MFYSGGHIQETSKPSYRLALLYSVCLSAFQWFWKLAVSEVQGTSEKPSWSSCNSHSLCTAHSFVVWYCCGLRGMLRPGTTWVMVRGKSFIWVSWVTVGVFMGVGEMAFIKGTPRLQIQCFSVWSAAGSSEITGR